MAQLRRIKLRTNGHSDIITIPKEYTKAHSKRSHVFLVFLDAAQIAKLESIEENILKHSNDDDIVRF